MRGYKDLTVALFELTSQDKGITLISSKEQVRYVSYGELWTGSSVLGDKLLNMGARKGSEVVIQCKSLEHYIYSLWACILYGFIAIPVEATSNEYKTESNQKIIEILDDPFLLFDDAEHSYAKSDKFKGHFLNVHTVDFSLNGQVSKNPSDFISDSQDVAYVQFSSGSTGDPKGIIIRKSNISANINGIIDHLEMDHTDRFLSWSPLTHCLGLVVFHLLPVMLGVNQYHIATEQYIHNPIIWLEMIHKYRITRLGTIPFALKNIMNACEYSEVTQEFDLSCVKSIIIGAEQVKIELCNRFIECMQTYNMNRDVLIPAYGITESTAMVTGNSLHTELCSYKLVREELDFGSKISCCSQYTDEGMSFIELGTSIPSVEMKIVDGDYNELEEATIGFLCLKGDSLASGYYKDRKNTRAAFYGDGWFNTGDLGFINNGNLVIVGREKELIVVNGKKYTCIDLEDIINRKALHYDWERFVVCNGVSMERKSEEAVVFVENALDLSNKQIRDRFHACSESIKKAVFETAGLLIQNVIPIDAIPKTYSGKIKRKELTNRFNEGEFIAMVTELSGLYSNGKVIEPSEFLTKEKIRTLVVDIIGTMLHLKVSDYDSAFQDYGIVSVNIPPFIEKINEIFDINIQVTAFFSNPNVNKLTDYIFVVKNQKNKERKVDMNDKKEVYDSEKIAIVGMSCRFPGGAVNIDEYWNVLLSGKDGIIDIPKSRWDVQKYYDEDETIPGKMYCKKGGFLEHDIDEFDARFFNISPKEVMALDPQQRLMLELTWEAFENAGLDITKYSGTNTGVYLGMSTTEYSLSHIYSGDFTKIDAYSLTGTCMSTACGRISYTFGFEGPCFAVDTACSSTLTALHLGCTAMQAGETDMVVVGGVNLMESPTANVGFSKLHATAPDGHSKAFDASADGYGRGEGGGVLILKKLSAAIADKDNILGIIKGTGINQDGKSNGLTAPNGASQAKLIRNTIAASGLKAEDIDYVEMHGTGTKLGDPIEVNAVAETYGKGRTAENLLKIGSVKSNIGHLEAAAGMASIIKVLLSMKNNLIPANLNFITPNPYINWEDAKVFVVSKHTVWESKDNIRRAAINGFGFGGSNAHVIIEEYNGEEALEDNPEEQDGINYILKLSAKSVNSLHILIENYTALIKNSAEAEFADIIYSADRGRADLEFRFTVQGANRKEILKRLEAYLEREETEGIVVSFGEKNIFKKDRKVVFMFTGQGSQYINMGKLLYKTNEVFKNAVNDCDKLFKPYLLKSVVLFLYGEKTSNEIIEKTLYAQPLIFTIEYALYKMWENYGVRPELVMGHSIGEYAAAVVSGIMSLEDAVKLVSIRGRLMDSAPGDGSMGTVFADEDVVKGIISGCRYSDTVSIAARNAKDTCVISGPGNEVEKILQEAQDKGIRVKKLKVSHAFHSKLMEPILEDFKAIAQEADFFAPKIRFVSSLYAKEIEAEQILDCNYWTNHIREKVDFYKAVTSIDSSEDYLLLEVGANRVLSAMCKLIFEEEKIIAGTLNVKKEDALQLSETIAELFAAGVNLNWNQIKFTGRKNWKKISLPGYPFERVRYWKELVYDREGGNVCEDDCHRLLGQRIELPCMNSGTVFQSKFTSQQPYFMKEHVIFNTAISPAAAHISMVLSALKEVKNPTSCMLKEIEFRAPLAVKDQEERQVQVCVENGEDNQTKFTIVSRESNSKNSKWLTHSTGNAVIYDEFSKNDISADISDYENYEFKKDAENTIYNFMGQSGFELGQGFRRIMKTYYGETDAVSFIEPLKQIPNSDMYILYPGTIDSVFQTGLTVILEQLKNEYSYLLENNATIIPYYIERLTYNFRESENLWCHTTDSSVKNDIIYSEITVFNEKGQLVMKIEGFMGKITSSENLLRELNFNPNSLYYHTDWIEDKKSAEALVFDVTKKYIVISEDKEPAAILCNGLAIKGIQPVTVLPGDGFEKKEEYEYRLDGRDKNNWSALLKHITETGNKEELRFIYYHSGKEISFTDRVMAEESSNDDVKLLLYLVQAINEAGYEEKSKIKIVTKEVHQIDRIQDANLSGAALWGFAKVLSMEFPGLFDGILDISETVLMEEKERLIAEILNHESEEICLRGKDERYTSRLIKHADYMKKSNTNHKKINIKEDASYLITGGTGALGIIYARYLVNSGAKNIILMCRREPGQDTVKKINELKEAGVKVEIVYADVCSRESVLWSMRNIRETMPEIKGVIHAAGAIKDKLIADQTWEEFELVLNPKIAGTLNVFHALKEEALDFFIMLSSITSVVGNLGQSNYAAANYSMNKIAEQMQRAGVAAYAMCWGPWQSGGMASGNEAVDKNMSAMGIKAFSSDTGIRIIEQFFDQPYENTVIADVDWEKMGSNIYGDWQKTFLTNVVSEHTEKDTLNSDDNLILEVLGELDSEAGKEFLLHTLQEKCGKIMGFGNDQLPAVDVGFREQGADSLMIFSMRSAVNKLLGTNIDVSTFFNYPTLVELTNYLINEILYSKSEEEQQSVSEESTEDILDELEKLLV